MTRLLDLKKGQCGTITKNSSSLSSMELGLTEGREVEVLHNRNGSVIVKTTTGAGFKLAFSDDIARQILVEVKEKDRFIKKVYTNVRKVLTRDSE